MPKKSGFTLIELLIAISIIAILAVMGIVVYTKFLQNARDAKRQSDLRTIQSAVEQYFADQLFYPSLIVPFNALTNCTGSNVSPCTATKTYLNNTPTDPISSGSYPSYSYVASGSSSSIVNCNNSTTTKCVSYCIYAKMENTSNTFPSICSNNVYSSGFNFAVTLP